MLANGDFFIGRQLRARPRWRRGEGAWSERLLWRRLRHHSTVSSPASSIWATTSTPHSRPDPTRPSYLFRRIDPECSLTSTSRVKSRDWLSPALFNFSLPFLCLLFFLHLLLFLLFLFFFSSGSPVSLSLSLSVYVQGIQPIRNISTVEMIFNCWQYLDVYQPCGFDIRLGFVTRLIYCRFGNVFLGHVFIVNFFFVFIAFYSLIFFSMM